MKLEELRKAIAHLPPDLIVEASIPGDEIPVTTVTRSGRYLRLFAGDKEIGVSDIILHDDALDGEESMAAMNADDDCEDQALVATKTCTKTLCSGQRPELVKNRAGFWCCPLCHSSYGTNPHPDLK